MRKYITLFPQKKSGAVRSLAFSYSPFRHGIQGEAELTKNKMQNNISGPSLVFLRKTPTFVHSLFTL